MSIDQPPKSDIMRLNKSRLSKLFKCGGRWVMYVVSIVISLGEVMSTLKPSLQYDYPLTPPRIQPLD